VVLRAEAIRRRLTRLEEVLSRLGELGYEAGDFRSAWQVERGLQLAAEIVFDVGNHILSAHFGVVAEDYEDILEKLAANLVISTELREQLAGLGGFRNVLVHGYLELDPERVATAHRDAPQQLSRYRLEIGEWLRANRSPA
jgi:uncharacterized protein YutE (UPF0331/DUF86 family)